MSALKDFVSGFATGWKLVDDVIDDKNKREDRKAERAERRAERAEDRAERQGNRAEDIEYRNQTRQDTLDERNTRRAEAEAQRVESTRRWEAEQRVREENARRLSAGQSPLPLPSADPNSPYYNNGTPPTQPSAPDRSIPSMTRPGQGASFEEGFVPFKSRLTNMESGGDYAILGPKHPKYGYAVGRYQVMESNIPSWTKQALGKPLTTAEFRADPKAQDAVFEDQTRRNFEKYGNWQDVASVWHSGRPLAEARRAGAKDSLGTRTEDYARKVGGIGRRAAIELLPEEDPRRQQIAYAEEVPPEEEREYAQFAAAGGEVLPGIQAQQQATAPVASRPTPPPQAQGVPAWQQVLNRRKAAPLPVAKAPAALYDTNGNNVGGEVYYGGNFRGRDYYTNSRGALVDTQFATAGPAFERRQGVPTQDMGPWGMNGSAMADWRARRANSDASQYIAQRRAALGLGAATGGMVYDPEEEDQPSVNIRQAVPLIGGAEPEAAAASAPAPQEASVGATRSITSQGNDMGGGATLAEAGIQPRNAAPGPGYDPKRMVNMEGAATAVHEGLLYIQDKFFGEKAGANAAIPEVSPANSRGAEAFARNEGAAPQSEIDQVMSVVDPEKQLTKEMRLIAGYHAAFDMLSKQGQPEKAKEAAAAMLLHSKAATARAGALAMAAYEKGDIAGLAKALKIGHDQIPDGKTIEIGKTDDGGVEYRLIDLTNDNKVLHKGRIGVNEMVKLATGMQDGTAWFEAVGAIKPKTPAERKLEQDMADRDAQERFNESTVTAADRDAFYKGMTPEAREAFNDLSPRQQRAARRSWMEERNAQRLEQQKQTAAREERLSPQERADRTITQQEQATDRALGVADTERNARTGGDERPGSRAIDPTQIEEERIINRAGAANKRRANDPGARREYDEKDGFTPTREAVVGAFKVNPQTGKADDEYFKKLGMPDDVVDRAANTAYGITRTNDVNQATAVRITKELWNPDTKVVPMPDGRVQVGSHPPVLLDQDSLRYAFATRGAVMQRRKAATPTAGVLPEARTATAEPGATGNTAADRRSPIPGGLTPREAQLRAEQWQRVDEDRNTDWDRGEAVRLNRESKRAAEPRVEMRTMQEEMGGDFNPRWDLETARREYEAWRRLGGRPKTLPADPGARYRSPRRAVPLE